MRELTNDFEKYKDSCFGILLYGSVAKREETSRSDIDVCLVKPEKGIHNEVLSSLGGKYDIKVFEDLPLYIKMDVIKNHEVIFGDELELSEYFYEYRKIWKDMEPRIKKNQFQNIEEKIKKRRKANEDKKVLRET